MSSEMKERVLFRLGEVDVVHRPSAGGEGRGYGLNLAPTIDVHLTGHTLVLYAPEGVTEEQVRPLLLKALADRPIWLRRLHLQLNPPQEAIELMKAIKEVGFPDLAHYARHLTTYHPRVVPVFAARLKRAGPPKAEGGWLRRIPPVVQTEPWDEALSELLVYIASSHKSPRIDDQNSAMLKGVTTLLRRPDDESATYPDDMDERAKFRLLLFLALCGTELAVDGFTSVDLSTEGLEDDAEYVCEVLARLHPQNVPPLLMK